jgi:serine/threonine protein kinase
LSATIGSKLGLYEITALLGKGGMGEVYRARDTRLKRDVAIKTLPDEFLHDADRLSRFQREAEVLAS